MNFTEKPEQCAFYPCLCVEIEPPLRFMEFSLLMESVYVTGSNSFGEDTAAIPCMHITSGVGHLTESLLIER